MDILKIEYIKKRDKILYDKKTRDSQKDSLLLNNWYNYIFSATPIETKIKNQNEMNFVRI
jgi:uncharacterized protein YeeX (DUF496 family)